MFCGQHIIGSANWVSLWKWHKSAQEHQWSHIYIKGILKNALRSVVEWPQNTEKLYQCEASSSASTRSRLSKRSARNAFFFSLPKLWPPNLMMVIKDVNVTLPCEIGCKQPEKQPRFQASYSYSELQWNSEYKRLMVKIGAFFTAQSTETQDRSMKREKEKEGGRRRSSGNKRDEKEEGAKVNGAVYRWKANHKDETIAGWMEMI